MEDGLTVINRIQLTVLLILFNMIYTDCLLIYVEVDVFYVSACQVTRQCFHHRCNHEYANVCHAFCVFVGHYCPESWQKAIF